jgi:hypothetical protein
MFGEKFHGIYFDKDSGAGGGAADTADSTGTEAKGEQVRADVENAGDDKAKSKQTAEKVTFTDAQQIAVDQIVKERLERAQRKAENEAEKLRKQAEEQSLLKNQEFEKLAEQRKTMVGTLEAQVLELTPYKEQAEKYKGAMEKIVKAQVDKLPPALKVLVEKLDPIEQITYMTEHAKELNIGIAGVPETKTNDTNEKLNEEARAKARNSNAKLVKGFFGG